MAELDKIRIGGVPEHFNLPILQAEENGDFASRGIETTWTNFKGGTGQMTKALRDDEIDVCVLLTEGIITDIINGNPSKIISNYVITPLIWGIHTGYESKLRHHEEIYDHQYAISRYGSGSHLMAIVDANLNKKSLNEEQFTVIKNLEGAVESLNKDETQVFYWEKYTTKPLVDDKQLRRIGEFITPWPCFVIAARDSFLEEKPEVVIRMLRTIHDSCDRFMQNPNSINEVAERYGLQKEDAERWFHSSEWAIHGWVSDKMLKSVEYYLIQAGIIEDYAKTEELVWQRN